MSISPSDAQPRATIVPNTVVPVRAVLAVSPKAFVAIWCAIQLFHIVCVIYSYAVIQVHRYFVVNDLKVTIDYMGATTFSYFEPVIGAHIVLVVCHAVAFMITLWWSVKYREWRFTDKSMLSKQRRLDRRGTLIRHNIMSGHQKASLRSIMPQETALAKFTRIAARTKLVSALKKPVRLIKNIASNAYERVGIFGFEGRYFEVGFVAIEVVEIVLQTYQAYKLSGLVSRVWINRLYAIVLILNCWSTAFVHSFVHRDRLVKRIVLLVMDALFDMITSMVIPFVIFYPYYLEFDISHRDFPLVNYYHDVWFIQAISENRQIFVTSWIDYISKISPGFSIFASVLVLKQYLVMDKARTRNAMQVALVLAGHTEGATIGRGRSILLKSRNAINAIMPTTHTRVVPSRSTQPMVTGDASAVSIRDAGGEGGSRLTDSERIVMVAALFAKHKPSWHDVLFVLCGLAILVIHVHATVVAVYSSLEGCLLEVRPWFQTSYSCVSLEVNCVQGQYANGSDTQGMQLVAKVVNLRGVKSVVVASCANLHVPPLLQTFSALQMIKVYNSTIERWGPEAELHQDFHHDLQMLYICDTNFTAGKLPIGILGDNFPKRLVDIEFSGTNLHTLPSDLHERWTFVQYFVLERSPGINEISDTLVKLKIPQLMLGWNSIERVPDDLFADQSFWVLRLDGNPLSALPQRIGSIERLYLVGVSFTLVSVLPPWMCSIQYDSVSRRAVEPFLGYVRLFAGSSPLCRESSEAVRSTAMSYFEWNCSTRMSGFAYPIEQERIWRENSHAARLASRG